MKTQTIDGAVVEPKYSGESGLSTIAELPRIDDTTTRGIVDTILKHGTQKAAVTYTPKGSKEGFESLVRLIGVGDGRLYFLCGSEEPGRDKTSARAALNRAVRVPLEQISNYAIL